VKMLDVLGPEVLAGNVSGSSRKQSGLRRSSPEAEGATLIRYGGRRWCSCGTPGERNRSTYGAAHHDSADRGAIVYLSSDDQTSIAANGSQRTRICLAEAEHSRESDPQRLHRENDERGHSAGAGCTCEHSVRHHRQWPNAFPQVSESCNFDPVLRLSSPAPTTTSVNSHPRPRNFLRPLIQGARSAHGNISRHHTAPPGSPRWTTGLCTTAERGIPRRI
jgi:hypothetical protein